MPAAEFALIARHFASAACAAPGDALVLGIGDDCAVLDIAHGQQLVVSTDTLNQGVHFPLDADPYALAWRALGCTLSDLAAMGARPLGFTLALSLPQADDAWLSAFAKGLNEAALRYRVRLVGGDTTRGALSINLTVLGRVPQGLALRRRGAQMGDLLCVGGVLGQAAAALPWVLGERTDTAAAAALLKRYWQPEPQIALGRALRGRASSVIDISDGLLADCGHLAHASGVTLEIDAARVPVDPLAQALHGSEAALAYALRGGDDYRLAFTLPKRCLEGLQAEGFAVQVVGRVLAGTAAVALIHHGERQWVQGGGYEHFAQGQHD
ncbi:thiamine-phosphate kinase [Atopomonas sediminilitoris]|uniref:thiamine-phosphate kinase n=1 Tax=Atopomonas sediminilitoris TaxID=2919919 RepID=UPI001F4E3DD5|nr:thiamine-phosphate kinase [Atopomonas sediminilitoris]MCJ8170211.1 thiamine-phosphate kinase [Atopomonas sediminilitoris]